MKNATKQCNNNININKLPKNKDTYNITETKQCIYPTNDNISKKYEAYMSQTNRRKTSISLTVSQTYLNKMNQLIKAGKFSSISDAINVAVSMYLGKISIYENNLNFDFSKKIELEENDKTPKKSISVTYSEFLDEELENLVAVTQKNKSYLVRLALKDFFEYYTNIEQHLKPKEEVNVFTKEDLVELIKEIVNDMESKKKN